MGDVWNFMINNFTRKKNNYVNYANKGMNLENDINITNSYYRDTNIALVYKKATPIKIIKVDYNLARIKDAVFENPSTLDYSGVYKGIYLDFDAKECNSKTSFPISNIHTHQIKHIRNVLIHKGISFLVVRFNVLDKTFVLFGWDLLRFIDNSNRKSIPYEYFLEYGVEIPIKYTPRVDYIRAIDKYITNMEVIYENKEKERC